jgi:hypothetical protein
MKAIKTNRLHTTRKTKTRNNRVQAPQGVRQAVAQVTPLAEQAAAAAHTVAINKLKNSLKGVRLVKNKFLYLPVLALSILAVTSCSKKQTSQVDQRLAQMAHDPSQCPNLRDGYYNAGNSKSAQFIEVYNDKNQNRIELNMNGYEKIPVIGQNIHQTNGYSITGSCIGKTIRLVGQDQNGNPVESTIRKSTDGGLDVDQNKPNGPSLHYRSAGALKSTADQIKKWFTPDSQGSGVPQN